MQQRGQDTQVTPDMTQVVSTTDTDSLLRAFFQMVTKLVEELDLKFKTYNR